MLISDRMLRLREDCQDSHRRGGFQSSSGEIGSPARLGGVIRPPSYELISVHMFNHVLTFECRNTLETNRVEWEYVLDRHVLPSKDRSEVQCDRET